ncbi:OLC1v1027760C1 [Oldenlandia corymbosa var. corymbosa]|uniref:OLC1v1027760C1 n=1 Tax=Oldenlandia corymbosa var. corymbosa TaxID=529605 RepID=A0AAV1CC72_OLDCO|nr:OLC1v1027760C1 [Oldenlandia corymbosa var. corymbosa]
MIPSRPFDYPPGFTGTIAKVGFGFDSGANAYKVFYLTMPNMEDPYVDDFVVDGQVVDDCCLIDIYNLSSNSWRRQNFSFEPGPIYYGIFFHGSYHWVSSHRGEVVIAVFDMSLEVAREMKCPDKNVFGCGIYSNFSILEGNLSFVLVSPQTYVSPQAYVSAQANIESINMVPQSVAIWVMTEYGNDASWTKKCTIRTFYGIFGNLSCWNNDRLLFDSNHGEENGVPMGELSSCELQEEDNLDIQQVKRYGIVGSRGSLEVVIYKESLAPVPIYL